jgi:leucyl-tRNA synthetase
MLERYDAAAVEAAAQSHWNASNAYRVVESGDTKFYACSFLPYPSGKLHMGHVRNYTINDVMTRYMRMRGFNVLMPMGWDAFGLPAENAAIEKGIAPAAWTRRNIADMKAQMQPLGLAFDWSREIASCDPSYYKWNQWFFLKMLERGIAYRKTQIVNWDPVDNTVLANEQVIDGRGWRSGALVEKREIPGYYLRITDYAEELLDGVVNKLPAGPSACASCRPTGSARVPASTSASPTPSARQSTCCASSRRAPTPSWASPSARSQPSIRSPRTAPRATPQLAAFIERVPARRCVGGEPCDAAEKLGMPTGFFVTHPLTREPIEVWVGNYVLMAYGEGAVMGVPGTTSAISPSPSAMGCPSSR